MSSVRRWVAVAVGAAVAVIIATASLARSAGPVGPQNPAPRDSVDLAGAIPWSDAPAPAYHPVKDSPVTEPAPDARPCTVGDLTAGFQEGNDGAGGHLLATVTFRNTGTSPCVLTGYPARVVVTEPGRPDVTATNGSFFPTHGTADMAPGQVTYLGLETDTYCEARQIGGPAGPGYHHVAVGLPAGGTVELDRPNDGFDVTCGLRLTEFFVPAPPPTEPRDPLTRLQSSLDLPSTVTAGTTLTYAVELENPTDRPITLDPCPGYLEAAFGPESLVKQSYALHCPPSGVVAAHTSVRFEMRMDLPPEITAGPVGVSWQLIGPSPSETHSKGTVTVVPPGQPAD